MFSGIVEETGKVLSFTEQAEAYRLTLQADTIMEGLGLGDSIACNGCCLTAVAFDPAAKTVEFDLLAETVRLTSFARLKPDDKVNLERSLAVGQRLGGHFVSGHIDCPGTVTICEARGKDTYLRVEPPAEFMRYLAYKGSISIDGISLTVAEVDDTGLAVWLIPHTMEVTNLHQRTVGDIVNLEFDLLAKYVERLLQKAELTKT